MHAHSQFAMKRSSGQVSEEAPLPKRPKVAQELFDISPIVDKKGDGRFYEERFFRWREINGRNDPNQPLKAKLNSWRTFVHLENESKMEQLLQRGRPRSHEEAPRSTVPGEDATGFARTRESHRERQTLEPGEVPTCLRSVGIQATGPDRSVDASSTVEPCDPRDQGLPQRSSDVLPGGQSEEAAGYAKSIERLWKWKSRHRAQIDELEKRCVKLQSRCDLCESRCNDFESLAVGQAALIETLTTSLAQSRELVDELQKNQEARARQHERLLASVAEAGGVLDNLRQDFDARLRDLESVKESSFDVLQRLYAEKKLQGDELTTLRDQVDRLHRAFQDRQMQG